MRELITAIKMTVVLTILTGLIYPMVVFGLAQLIFPWQANGSLESHGNQIVGSAIIGQNFAAPRYFHPRPSAAGNGYDPTQSSGTNLGPTNSALIKSVSAHLQQVLKENPGVTANQVPVDLVTSSGSGLDPEISPAAAELQVARVAKARNLAPVEVEDLVAANTRGRWIGLFGEPGVNVLKLNLALDRILGGGATAAR